MDTEFCILNNQVIPLVPMKTPLEGMHGDYMLDLPHECLSLIFSSLSQSDRNTCSLVCYRWYRVEAESRQRLVLNASSTLEAFLPALLTRFENATKLALKTYHLRAGSISNDSLSFISTKLPQLTNLKLQSCYRIRKTGISALATCRWLRKLSFSSCYFGPRELVAILTSCRVLEHLSLKRLRSYFSALEVLAELTCSDRHNVKSLLGCETLTCSDSLKSVCLKDSNDSQWIIWYLARCKNLRTIKILRCSGSWNRSLDLDDITSRIPDITVQS